MAARECEYWKQQSGSCDHDGPGEQERELSEVDCYVLFETGSAWETFEPLKEECFVTVSW